jgi:hypothetical protein
MCQFGLLLIVAHLIFLLRVHGCELYDVQQYCISSKQKNTIKRPSVADKISFYWSARTSRS